METTLLLTRFWGIFLFVICMLLLLRGNLLLRELFSILKEPVGRMSMGFMLVFIGAMSIAYHNIWQWNLAGIMTLFGWATLAKGAVFLLCPKFLEKTIKIYKKNFLPFQLLLGTGAMLGLLFLYLSHSFF